MPTTGSVDLVLMEPRPGTAPSAGFFRCLVTSQYEPSTPGALALGRASLTRAKVAGVVRPATEAMTM